MKLTFTAQDSIYKIFSLLKKVPRGKHVDIFIDHHELLQDPRRTESFVKHLRELEITATVSTKNQQLIDQLIPYGIQTNYTGKKSLITRIIQGISGKKYTPLSRDAITSKLSLLAEIGVVLAIIYLFWGTIAPTATISITPTTLVQPMSYSFLITPAGQKPELSTIPLAIDWYTGSIQYSASKTINLQDSTFQIRSAQGAVSFSNTLSESFSLVENTTLTTDSGILFTTTTPVQIPGGTEDNPGKATVQVVAKERFENGLPIGEEGNISKETKLRVQKLSQSIDAKELRATPIQSFTQGETLVKGTVISSDIQKLEKELLLDIRNQLEGIIRLDVKNTNRLALPLDDEIAISTLRFVTNAQPGESASFLQGTIDVTIIYPYALKSDLEKQGKNYLHQRTSTNIHQDGLSVEHFTLYDPRKIGTGAYMLPITFQTFSRYDFANDTYGIIEQLKENIVGHTRKEAEMISLRFNEIHAVDIAISPFWYTSIPQNTQSVTVKIKE